MKISMNIAVRHYRRCIQEYACQLHELSKSEKYIHSLIAGTDLSTFEQGLREMIEDAALR